MNLNVLCNLTVYFMLLEKINYLSIYLCKFLGWPYA